jgi:hypothetical protein
VPISFPFARLNALQAAVKYPDSIGFLVVHDKKTDVAVEQHVLGVAHAVIVHNAQNHAANK